MRKASLLTLFLVMFIDLMGFGIILPNLQLYGMTFGIESYFTLTLMGASYSICQFFFTPILGSWSDRVGRRPVMVVSQVGTLVGFLILFAAHFFETGYGNTGIVLIFVSRIIDGISGGNISTAMAYVADITTPENRAKGMGIVMAGFGLGFMFGPAIGGMVAKLAGLQWVPIAAAVFSLAALILTLAFLPESLDPAHKTPASELRRYNVTTIVHALARPLIGPMILMSFVNGFAFAGMEQTYSMLIKLRVFKSPVDVMHRDLLTKAATESSWSSSLLFLMIGFIIVVIQGGAIHRLTKKFGEARLAIAGPMLIAAGMFIIALDLPRLIPGLWIWTGFVIGSACLATGSSLFNPSMSSLISRHAGKREQGELLGAMQGMASLARALGPVVAGLLFQFVLPGTVWQGSAPYWLSGALCLIVAMWAMGMRAKLVPPVSDAERRDLQPIRETDKKEWE